MLVPWAQVQFEGDVGVVGATQLRWRASCDDPTLIEDDQVVDDSFCFGDVVGHQQHAGTLVSTV